MEACMAYLDSLFPWFADMLSLGGSILLVIVIISVMMWGYVFERFVYFWLIFPREKKNAFELWRQRKDHRSWYALKFNRRLQLYLVWGLDNHISMIRMLIVICPFLGLLGTVLGMLEVFDGMAATGNNSAKTTAAGVSKATVSTMAGMVVAISGLLITIVLDRKVKKEKIEIAAIFTAD